ncbi:MAG: hypothetical protein HY817_00360 [Candidatus Abawacabacteria bacterium]|nr:hypothetical protein [Candidatus Abawacabacteria bacterium]
MEKTNSDVQATGPRPKGLSTGSVESNGNAARHAHASDAIRSMMHAVTNARETPAEAISAQLKTLIDREISLLERQLYDETLPFDERNEKNDKINAEIDALQEIKLTDTVKQTQWIENYMKTKIQVGIPPNPTEASNEKYSVEAFMAALAVPNYRPDGMSDADITYNAMTYAESYHPELSQGEPSHVVSILIAKGYLVKTIDRVHAEKAISKAQMEAFMGRQ